MTRHWLIPLLTIVATTCVAFAQTPSPATTRPATFYRGVDISMLPEIERAGGKYVDPRTGAPGDAVKIFHEAGVNLFRVRLFVNPTTDFNRSWGATQDLPMVRALAKRITRQGGRILLDLHYSDTWADGEKQAKPKAWEGQSFDQLEQTVHDYTASVLKAFAEDGVRLEMVQIGNEIAGGMLFPDAKVLNAPKADEAQQWSRFARVLNAGARAVREASTPDNKIAVMIHIHGGGRVGLPKWFFGKLLKNPVDFDVIGLSVYPAWGDTLEALKGNLDDLAATYGKPVVVAETGYPWKPEEDATDAKLMRWPQTPEGQVAFVRDLTATLRAAPNGTGAGMIWWYPEAVPSNGLFLWRGGAEAMFDPQGKPLPILSAFGKAGDAATPD